MLRTHPIGAPTVPCYEHKTDGRVDERVLAVPESYNDGILAARADDKDSGWSRVDEFVDEQPGEQPAPAGQTPPPVSPGQGTAPADVPDTDKSGPAAGKQVSK